MGLINPKFIVLRFKKNYINDNKCFFMNLNSLKIAIVCDWLTSSGGAEKVILSMHRMFPNAPIYTALYNQERVKGFEDAKIITSYLQKIPGASKKHQLLISQMPRAFESFNLDQYDIVLSSSHACAKGVITNPATMHICYCHSPMRYAWENSINYVKEYSINPIVKKIAPWMIHKLRLWDRVSAERVDHFLTNSNYVKKRIFKYYRKRATVIYPFVNTEKFTPSDNRGDYYLAVGRLTPYKKFDLIVDSFSKSGKSLKIAGTGVAEKDLKNKAGDNIDFLGYVSDNQLTNLYQQAKALIFPQIEDFGIIPLEAMACGCPVIAYGKGGALETVKEGVTGIFFDQQSSSSLTKAIQEFEKHKFNHRIIRKHAEKFSESVFSENLLKYIENNWEQWDGNKLLN